MKSSSNHEDNVIINEILETYAVVESAISNKREDKEYVPLFMEGYHNLEIVENKKVEDTNDKQKDENQYKVMSEYQFGYTNLLNGGQYHHNYASDANSIQSKSKERILRIAQETGALPGALPLNTSSSVFVRIDEERIDVMSALISGPDGTPYSGGCFVFDIFFPDNYPNGPPKVWLMTTGGNTFRFNPNLYANGKVCLSLLGTWSGSEGETWNKDTSTLLQVLVSIQSLIMVPDPYFNEPGYERSMGTNEGRNTSREYNLNIKEGNIRYAMLAQLRNPTYGFETIIKEHFRLRKTTIMEEVIKWREEAKGCNSPHYNNLNELSKQLETELSKL
jgi:baculoviral IAP repeat-containing protein 6